MRSPNVVAQTSGEDGKLPTSPHSTRHKHRHKGHGLRGKRVIVAMATLTLSFLGLALYLAATGNPHPLTADWGFTTLMITHGLVSMVTVLCLFLLFRGSVPARQLMGASALVITFGYLMMITLNLLREPVALWTAFDLFGAFTAAVVTWACLFSRRVSAFLRYKEDFHS